MCVVGGGGFPVTKTSSAIAPNEADSLLPSEILLIITKQSFSCLHPLFPLSACLQAASEQVQNHAADIEPRRNLGLGGKGEWL